MFVAEKVLLLLVISLTAVWDITEICLQVRPNSNVFIPSLPWSKVAFHQLARVLSLLPLDFSFENVVASIGREAEPAWLTNFIWKKLISFVTVAWTSWWLKLPTPFSTATENKGYIITIKDPLWGESAVDFPHKGSVMRNVSWRHHVIFCSRQQHEFLFCFIQRDP